MNGDGVADALAAVADQLGCRGSTLAVDGLGVAALGRIGRVLGASEAKDVGPLLERLGVCWIVSMDLYCRTTVRLTVGVAERAVSSSVPAVETSCQSTFYTDVSQAASPYICMRGRVPLKPG